MLNIQNTHPVMEWNTKLIVFMICVPWAFHKIKYIYAIFDVLARVRTFDFCLGLHFGRDVEILENIKLCSSLRHKKDQNWNLNGFYWNFIVKYLWNLNREKIGKIIVFAEFWGLNDRGGFSVYASGPPSSNSAKHVYILEIIDFFYACALYFCLLAILELGWYSQQ